jgi:hypothetical protein
MPQNCREELNSLDAEIVYLSLWPVCRRSAGVRERKSMPQSGMAEDAASSVLRIESRSASLRRMNGSVHQKPNDLELTIR